MPHRLALPSSEPTLTGPVPRRRPPARLLLLAAAPLALLGLSGCLGAPPAEVAAGDPTGDPAARSGPVLAVGGGGTPRSVVRLGLERAPGGPDQVRVAVVPFASSREGRGVGSVEMWLEEGAMEAALVPEDRSARGILEAADVIWLGGGSQHQLMDTLERLDLVEVIRERHRAGALVGGTSAGAAVLGGVLISGSPDPDAYLRGAVPTRRALDLVPGVLVDQHFRERNREGRLLTAVIDGGGEWLGVGISESTAALFQGRSLEVAGEGVVLVFDARRATVAPAEPGAPRSASGVLVSVHPPGERVPLAPTSGEPGDPVSSAPWPSSPR